MNTRTREKQIRMKHHFCLIVAINVLLFPVQNLLGQSSPHHLAGIAATSGGVLMLIFEGSTSNLFSLPLSVSNQFQHMFDLFPLDSSPDLVTWSRRTILLRTNSSLDPLVYSETNLPLIGAQFYRTPTNHFLTGFPAPTGPFTVGNLVRVLTDSSRSNRYSLLTNSSFMCSIWYPAALPDADKLPGAYTDAAVATDRNFYLYWAWPIAWTNIIARCVTHSYAALTAAPGTNRFPIILHSHGFTCDRTLNSETAAELASHGYIVAAVDHEDCHATVFPDSRGARYVPPGSRTDGTNLVPSRIRDLQFLLSQLGEMDTTDPVLAGRLDLERVGVMGHSFGGGTAAEVGRLDTRVRAAALLEPYIDSTFDPVLITNGLQKPFVVVNSTLPTHTDLIGTPAESAAISANLYNLAVTNATWFKVAGIGHFGFSDLAWTQELTSTSSQGATALNASLVWFFDTYLKDEAPPFPTNPAIYSFVQKFSEMKTDFVGLVLADQTAKKDQRRWHEPTSTVASGQPACSAVRPLLHLHRSSKARQKFLWPFFCQVLLRTLWEKREQRLPSVPNPFRI
jgi:dienelactone hydrolase